jgi:hypothetical protein
MAIKGGSFRITSPSEKSLIANIPRPLRLSKEASLEFSYDSQRMEYILRNFFVICTYKFDFNVIIGIIV